MPLSIIRDDITRIKCDAIINPTNEEFFPGGGIDKRVHRVAGEELYEMCSQLGGLEVGKAKITPAYNLPCRFVIHTVGPCWDGGSYGEEEYLKSCYKEALKIVVASKCESVAFPLISSGTYGYPKDQVLSIALEILKEFLLEHDIMIYLVVFDKTSYELSKDLQDGIASFIDQNYVESEQDCFEKEYDEICYKACLCESKCMAPRRFGAIDEDFDDDDFDDDFDDVDSISFRETLFEFLDQKGIDEVECYKRANVSRQTWHKIVSDKNYVPKKTTIIALAIAMKLDIEETQVLLETMGFVLSKSIKFDLIIRYCIIKGIYDVYEIDAILFQYDQKTLFSIE